MGKTKRWFSLFRSNSKRSSGTISTVISASSLKSCDEGTEIPQVVEFSKEQQQQPGDERSSSQEHDDTNTKPFVLEDVLQEAREAQNDGEYRLSLQLYQTILAHVENEPDADVVMLANVSYTCSKLARRLHDYPLAYRHAQDELRFTQRCGAPVTADYYCDLAQLCHHGLGDSTSAMAHYTTALALDEAQLRRTLRPAVAACADCASHTTIRDLCAVHRPQATELYDHMRETKQCIGRIHFELGNMADAMRML